MDLEINIKIKGGKPEAKVSMISEGIEIPVEVKTAPEGKHFETSSALETPPTASSPLRSYKRKNTLMDVRPSTDPLAELEIRVDVEGGDHIVKLGDIGVKGTNLRSSLINLGLSCGWGSTEGEILNTLRGMPGSCNRDMLIGILEGEEPEEVQP